MTIKVTTKSVDALIDGLMKDSEKYGVKLSTEYEKLFKDKCRSIGGKTYDVLEKIITKREGFSLYKIYDTNTKSYMTVSSEDIVEEVDCD